MRDLINLLEALEATDLNFNDIDTILKNTFGFITKKKGNTIVIMADLPDKRQKEFRIEMMQTLAVHLTKLLKMKVIYNPTQTSISTIGYVEIVGNPVKILVKDATKQGVNRAGVANEHQLATLIQQEIDQRGSVTITFVDPAGKNLIAKNITAVKTSGSDTKGGKKADVVLYGKNIEIPISIKQLNADVWESADSLFGKRAREILLKLRKEKLVKVTEVGKRDVRGELVPVYKLDKEIVVEPTPEDAMRAIFGSDLNPKGGIIIQDFQPHHFKQLDNKITVDCYAVIKNKEDIPESHVMYFLIKNFPGRAALGFYGIGTQAVTMTRAFGKKLTKNPIFVDQFGNPIKSPAKQDQATIEFEPKSKPRAKRTVSKSRQKR
jgi:hypothetical protein